MPSSVGVTATSQMETTVLETGQIVTVIDTPGFLDTYVEPEMIRDELVKCITMAREGIHAVLLVLSVQSRFSREEKNVVETLIEFFGREICDYMIVVFTGGDDLEASGTTIDKYLERICPDMKEILELCGNRRILFDNNSKNDQKKFEQVKRLFSLVNEVVDRNGGKPYTNELFRELKKKTLQLREQVAHVNSMKGHSEQQIAELKEQLIKSYQEQIKKLADMVDSKLNQSTLNLEIKLSEEKLARLKAEEMAKAAQSKSDEEMRMLRKKLEDAEMSIKKEKAAQSKSEEEMRKLRKEMDDAQTQPKSKLCAIL